MTFAEPAAFDISLVINIDNSRDFLTVSSNITWSKLSDDLAKLLNVHPDSVHVQWRLSSEPQRTLPGNLRNSDDLEKFINYVRPILTKKRRAEPPSILIFKKGADLGQTATATKV